MNSTHNLQNLYCNLIEISEDLKNYSNLSREDLFTAIIDERLKDVLRAYNTYIDLASTYLVKKESEAVLKTLLRIKRFDDQAVIEENFINDKDSNNDEFIN